MKVNTCRHTEVEKIVACLTRLRPRTVILDVEPLVAYWNGGTAALDDGVARWIGLISALPSVETLAFATNSRRRPSVTLTHPRLVVHYHSTAFKPFRTSAFRRLPRPGLLIGDQTATDGLLAWRLGYTFVHYHPQHHRSTIGVHLMHLLGHPMRPFLFNK